MATKNLTVRIRCTEREKADWQRAAGGERAFSDWARRTLNGASQQRPDVFSDEGKIALDKYQAGPDWHSPLPLAPADTASSRPSGKRSYEPDFK